MRYHSDMTIWKNIDDMPDYEVSQYGNVRNKNTLQILKPSYSSNGYYLIGPMRDKKQVMKKIHRLVAAAFCDNPMNKPQVNHIDGVKENNNATNLEWCTMHENLRHAKITGLHHKKHLSDETVLAIRNDIYNNNMTNVDIANRYGVQPNTISYIKHGKRYASVR